MAAKGMTTSYYKHKGTPFSALMTRKKELTAEVRQARDGAKKAQDLKVFQPKNRDKLEDIRRQFAANRDKAKKDLREVNKLLKAAEDEGKVSSKERADALDFDRELRRERTKRAEEIQEKVREIPGEKFLPGTPTKARIRVVGPNIVGTRKADVIISGEQGIKREKKRREEELAQIVAEEDLALEVKKGPKKKRVKLKSSEFKLTPEEEAAGKKLRAERKRARPAVPAEEPMEEPEVQVVEVEQPQSGRQILILPTKEDAAEERKTREEFIDLEELQVRR
jgi:hypothetical protein